MRDEIACLNYLKHRSRLRQIGSLNRRSLLLAKGEDMAPYHRSDLNKLKNIMDSLGSFQLVEAGHSSLKHIAAQLNPQQQEQLQPRHKHQEISQAKDQRQSAIKQAEKLGQQFSEQMSASSDELDRNAWRKTQAAASQQQWEKKQFRSINVRYAQSTSKYSSINLQSTNSNRFNNVQSGVGQMGNRRQIRESSHNSQSLRFYGQAHFYPQGDNLDQRIVLLRKTKIYSLLDALLIEISLLAQGFMLVTATQLTLKGSQWAKTIRWNSNHNNQSASEVAAYLESHLAVSQSGIYFDLPTPLPRNPKQNHKHPFSTLNRGDSKGPKSYLKLTQTRMRQQQCKYTGVEPIKENKGGIKQDQVRNSLNGRVHGYRFRRSVCDISLSKDYKFQGGCENIKKARPSQTRASQNRAKINQESIQSLMSQENKGDILENAGDIQINQIYQNTGHILEEKNTGHIQLEDNENYFQLEKKESQQKSNEYKQESEKQKIHHYHRIAQTHQRANSTMRANQATQVQKLFEKSSSSSNNFNKDGSNGIGDKGKSQAHQSDYSSDGSGSQEEGQVIRAQQEDDLAEQSGDKYQTQFEGSQQYTQGRMLQESKLQNLQLAQKDMNVQEEYSGFSQNSDEEPELRQYEGSLSFDTPKPRDPEAYIYEQDFED